MKSEQRERKLGQRERLLRLYCLVEKAVVVQCFLTARLTVSGEGESSSCPVC